MSVEAHGRCGPMLVWVRHGKHMCSSRRFMDVVVPTMSVPKRAAWTSMCLVLVGTS